MASSVQPRSFGRYRIRRVLGEGAMGVVYLAWDPELERAVALKTTRADLQLAPHKAAEYRRRFQREAKLAAGLRHPAIVTVYDVGEEDGRPYFAMEYVAGVPLSKIMQARRDPAVVVKILAKVADGLAYAHRSGIVHRDVKPGNILIGQGGEVKITDFGIARPDVSDLTQEGQMLGSPSYMAPEQIRGGTVGPPADLFALGVVAYTWLTGVKPFAAESVSAIIKRILEDEPTPPTRLRPELPAAVDAFFARALAKDPEARFADAKAFARELRAACLVAGLEPPSEREAHASPAVQEVEVPVPRAPLAEPESPEPVRDSGDYSRVDLVLHRIARSSRERRGPGAGVPAWLWWLAALAMVGTIAAIVLK